jgi:hypothetical protein
MARTGRPVLKTVPPGPGNPLGDRWLGRKGINVGIHGTNQPTSVYRFTTHGCFRLHPDDAQALFELVGVGSSVSSDLSRLASDLLRDAGVADPLTEESVRQCFRERRGRMCKIAGID